MGGRDAPLRRERDARPSGGSRKDRRCRSPMRSRARSRQRTREAPVVEAEPVARCARAISSDRTTRRFATTPDLFPARDAAALTQAEPRGARSRAPAAARARQARPGTARPRRPAPRQHRADRRQPGAVRCDRVRPADRGRRRALRSRLPADGPDRARPEAGREHRCSTAISPRPAATSDLDALAALPLFMSLRAAIRAKVTAARLETAMRTSATRIAKAAQHLFQASPAA